MFDELSFEFKGDHLHLVHEDDYEITAAGVKSFWGHLLEQCDNHGCASVLVEANAPTPRVDSIAAFTSGVVVTSIAPNIRVALCCRGYERDGITALFRQAARNRGASVEFFSDREAALVWLRANNPSF